MLIWAVLQFALPSAASYADALLERASIRALGSHIEAHGTKACAAAHPADCAICQLVHRLDPMSVARVPVGTLVRVAIPLESLTLAATPWERGRIALPRAPPTA